MTWAANRRGFPRRVGKQLVSPAVGWWPRVGAVPTLGLEAAVVEVRCEPHIQNHPTFAKRRQIWATRPLVGQNDTFRGFQIATKSLDRNLKLLRQKPFATSVSTFSGAVSGLRIHFSRYLATISVSMLTGSPGLRVPRFVISTV